MSVLALVFSAASAYAQSPDSNYIGAERCKACHELEYQVWADGPHRRASAALTAEQLGDPKCNNCHTMTAENVAGEKGVECERCHGPGRYYHPRFVMKDRELAQAVGLIEPKPAHCLQCHTEGAPSIRPFDYAQAWAKIAHGKAAREAWLKARQSEASGGK